MAFLAGFFEVSAYILVNLSGWAVFRRC